MDFDFDDNEGFDYDFFTNVQEEGGFTDAFSQILNEPLKNNNSNNNNDNNDNSDNNDNGKKRRAPPRKKPPTQPATLDDFEEAFTALKSIQAAHEPISTTAINAFLFYRRGVDINKRTVEGLTWPEHAQSFSKSRLISGHSDYTDIETDERPSPSIPPFYTDISDDSDTDDSEMDKNVPICEMNQNPNLHAALLRTCQSIYRKKFTSHHPHEIDPHLSHVIARRCSFLLQQVFSRALLTRRSAVKVLQQNPQTYNTDVENVPINWEDTREAARQIVGQAALDFNLFSKFSARLNRTFFLKK